jgi:hypothetical protein
VVRYTPTWKWWNAVVYETVSVVPCVHAYYNTELADLQVFLAAISANLHGKKEKGNRATKSHPD